MRKLSHKFMGVRISIVFCCGSLTAGCGSCITLYRIYNLYQWLAGMARFGKNLNELESWPMSSSYPQGTGEKEFREISKEIRNKMESEKSAT